MGSKIDYTGKRFGMIKIEGMSNEKTSGGQIKWIGRCDCGSLRSYRIQKSRPLKSCGCERINSVVRSNEKDISGIRFGRTVAIKKNGRNPSGAILWECKCDCGNIHLTSGANLRYGSAKSCGCAASEARANAAKKHGMSNTSIYKRWESILQRCTNPKSKNYKDYGGRGILVCEEWLDFNRFYQDMGDIPFTGATIDRIDNDKGYSKDNCEWTNYSTQLANQRVKNKHGYKGVYSYGDKFGFKIRINGIIYRESGFLSAKDAGDRCSEVRVDVYNRK